MITIKEFINKIRWDKNLDKDDYLLHYLDRIIKSEKTIKFEDIESLEGDFLMFDNKELPLHRIRKVTRFGKVVWER
jgi:uncharacterized protein (UPF0248 family)|tara:strand:- start:45399 stop:45626 length:228 start_codon:yes stop_codon:yes gene_type:complete